MNNAKYEYRTFEADGGAFWSYQQVGVYDHPEYGECVFAQVTYPIPMGSDYRGWMRAKKGSRQSQR